MTQTVDQLAAQEQTLGSIRGIVRTMKALAAVNAPAYEQAAHTIAAYQKTIEQGFAAFAWCARENTRENALLPPAPGAAGGRMVVAFGSDHGFCGNYNGLIARAVRAGDQSARGLTALICVGARLQAALQEYGLRIDAQVLPAASTEGLGRVAGDVVTWMEQLGREHLLQGLRVDLAFMRRTAHGGQAPVLSALLPLDPKLLAPARRWPSRALPLLRRPPAELLPALIRHYLFARAFQAGAEALVTENAARLARMQQAEQSVDERLAVLERQLAGLRQDAITDELMDIVIGHETHRRRRRKRPGNGDDVSATPAQAPSTTPQT
ncbi:MAG: F0F1 ATP synthase subunit gamma [Castellaniella sp.]